MPIELNSSARKELWNFALDVLKAFVYLNLFMLLIGLATLKLLEVRPDVVKHQKVILPQLSSKTLRYWSILNESCKLNRNLSMVHRVFDQLGYQNVNGLNGDDWDVFWSHDFPFSTHKSDNFETILQSLKPNQLINHIPGLESITVKDSMSSRNGDLEFILPAFEFPDMIDDFKKYIAANPTKNSWKNMIVK